MKKFVSKFLQAALLVQQVGTVQLTMKAQTVLWHHLRRVQTGRLLPRSPCSASESHRRFFPEHPKLPLSSLHLP